MMCGPLNALRTQQGNKQLAWRLVVQGLRITLLVIVRAFFIELSFFILAEVTDRLNYVCGLTPRLVRRCNECLIFVTRAISSMTSNQRLGRCQNPKETKTNTSINRFTHDDQYFRLSMSILTRNLQFVTKMIFVSISDLVSSEHNYRLQMFHHDCHVLNLFLRIVFNGTSAQYVLQAVSDGTLCAMLY